MDEIIAGEVGFEVECFFPALTRFFLEALVFEDVAEIEQCFGKVFTLGEGFVVEAGGVIQLAGFLEQEGGVVEQLWGAFAAFDETGLQVDRLRTLATADGG